MALKPTKQPPFKSPCYGRMYEETFRFCIECVERKACKAEQEKRGGDKFWPLGSPG